MYVCTYKVVRVVDKLFRNDKPAGRSVFEKFDAKMPLMVDVGQTAGLLNKRTTGGELCRLCRPNWETLR